MSEVDLHPISFGRVSLNIYNQTKELANFLPLLMKLQLCLLKVVLLKYTHGVIIFNFWT